MLSSVEIRHIFVTEAKVLNLKMFSLLLYFHKHKPQLTKWTSSKISSPQVCYKSIQYPRKQN